MKLGQDSFERLDKRRAGIYALVKDGEVVYIGKSKNVYARIHRHKTDKDNISCYNDFDEEWVRFCDIKDLDKLERQMIRKYCPKNNREHNPNYMEQLFKDRGGIIYNPPDINIDIEHIGNRKLTKETVLEIKRLWELKYNKHEIARRTGTSDANVYAIVKGITWKWLIDKDSKPPTVGRGPRMQRNHSTKLTEDDVHEIRKLIALFIPLVEIGKRFNVSPSTIGGIRSGRTWAWLASPQTFVPATIGRIDAEARNVIGWQPTMV